MLALLLLLVIVAAVGGTTYLAAGQVRLEKAEVADRTRALEAELAEPIDLGYIAAWTPEEIALGLDGGHDAAIARIQAELNREEWKHLAFEAKRTRVRAALEAGVPPSQAGEAAAAGGFTPAHARSGAPLLMAWADGLVETITPLDQREVVEVRSWGSATPILTHLDGRL